MDEIKMHVTLHLHRPVAKRDLSLRKYCNGVLLSFQIFKKKFIF